MGRRIGNMPARGFTRYSVQSSRREISRERRSRAAQWLLLVAACVVIVVFAYLLLAGGIG
jgi:hypothetical protein